MKRQLNYVWIVQPGESACGEALRGILETTGGFGCVYKQLGSEGDGATHGSASASAHGPGALAAGHPVAGYVVKPAGMTTSEHQGLRDRMGLPRDIPWFLVSEAGECEMIVFALQQGYTDYVLSPLRAADVLPRLWRNLDWHPSGDPADPGLKERMGLGHIIGNNPTLLAELRKLPMMARCSASVLIGGETGTGKEAFARAIHHLGPRSSKPFVALNCGAIPPDLMENELFGHESGAFTGATSSRAGLVEEADGGTLFLDEVDCLPLVAQVKLLRLLQEKEYRHLGSRKTCRVDVRVVAAANTDLEVALRQNRFRADLYYRINVLPLRLPPLRERTEDLPLLARHFATKYARAIGRAPRPLSPSALALLAQHHWPGNVRELENVIERAVLLTEGSELQSADLAIDGLKEEISVRITLREQKARVVRRFEREYLSALMARHGGNVSRAAVEAGKNRRALFELLRRHGLSGRDFVPPEWAGQSGD